MQARLVIASLLALCALPAAGSNTDGWYQVEVIVFANNSTTDTNEQWPLKHRDYPANMVTIGPTSSDELHPSTLGQMQDLERYLGMWDPASAAPSNEVSDFLFESRAPVNRTSTSTRASAPETIDAASPDAGSGLNPEETELDYDALFATDAPTAYQNLPGQERLLTRVARSLNRSSMYRVLLHQSWLQPIRAEASATPVLIQGGKRYDATYELDGIITLSRARFLHIETDLWFTEFSPLTSDSLTSYGANGANGSPLDSKLTISRDIRQRYPEVADWLSNQGQYVAIHTHHLNQSRRMRSATMHFIDHPKLGVLIRTERYEPPQAETLSASE